MLFLLGLHRFCHVFVNSAHDSNPKRLCGLETEIRPELQYCIDLHGDKLLCPRLDRFSYSWESILSLEWAFRIEALCILGRNVASHFLLLYQKYCHFSTIFKPDSEHSLGNFWSSDILFEFALTILHHFSLSLFVGMRVSNRRFSKNFHRLQTFRCMKPWIIRIVPCTDLLFAPWTLSWIAEIIVRRSNSMFSSLPLKWTDLFPFPLLFNSPLSKALESRNIGWPLSAKLCIIRSAVLSHFPSGWSE